MFRLKTSCLLAPILALAWISLVSPAYAGRLDIFTGVVGRYVFERPAGHAILDALGADSVDDLVRILAQPEMRSIRGELYVNLKHAEESVLRLRKNTNEWDPHSRWRKIVAKAMGKPVLPDDIPLSVEEKAQVDWIVAREMRLTPGWNKAQVLEEIETRRLEYLAGRPSKLGYEANEIKLLDRYENFDATKLPVAEPSEAALRAEAEVAWESQSLYNRMRTCRELQPETDVAGTMMRQRLMAMGIAPVMTTVGHLVSTKFGQREFDTGRYVFDLGFGMAWQAFSMFAFTRAEQPLLQWMISSVTGEGRVLGEVTFYYFAKSNRDLHGSKDLLNFNSKWNASTSWIPVTTYELLSGLECLPGTWGKTNSTLTRLLFSAGTTAAYFTLRWDKIKQ